MAARALAALAAPRRDLLFTGLSMPGGAHVLAKPYRRTDLADRVRAVLGRRDGRPDPGPAREG